MTTLTTAARFSLGFSIAPLLILVLHALSGLATLEN
jgi:hypothetical protein